LLAQFFLKNFFRIVFVIFILLFFVTMSKQVLYDALLTEMGKYFKSGGNAKSYGQWKKMATILKEKHEIEIDSEKLRKAWNYLVTGYRRDRDALRHQTGQSGYDAYWEGR
jgi:hypothetical protein